MFYTLVLHFTIGQIPAAFWPLFKNATFEFSKYKSFIVFKIHFWLILQNYSCILNAFHYN